MPRHIEAILDGVALSSLGPFIIEAVHEDPATMELTEGERPGRPGTLLLTRKRQSLKVALEIAIRELYDLPARAYHMETLAQWADGTVLQLSNRPFRRLNVRCTNPPALGSVRDFTSLARVELTAYSIPYWEDEKPTAWAVEDAASGSVTPIIPGTAETPVCLSITPLSAALSSFSVTVGGETVSFTGLSVPAGSVFEIGRDAIDNLSARCGATPLLSHRTAASADDLFAAPGPVQVSFSANTAADVTVSVRGRWR